MLRGARITPISKQIKCISPQARSVYNPAGDAVSRPQLLLRDREVVNRNRTRQIFEILICSILFMVGRRDTVLSGGGPRPWSPWFVLQENAYVIMCIA